jgi:hypothetical protein
MIAAAMSTLYSFTPVLVFTRLFRATVTGWLSLPEKTTPNRKSFQIWVVCPASPVRAHSAVAEPTVQCGDQAKVISGENDLCPVRQRLVIDPDMGGIRGWFLHARISAPCSDVGSE